MNIRQRCANQLRELVASLDAVHPGDLDNDELLALVREGAVAVERFVRRLSVPARRHVYHYVEDLGAAGLPDESVAALHALRTKANGGKHDTESEASHAEARHLLDDARVAVEQIGVVGSAPGADMESDTVGRRRFGLMVADYPTGGEVDYEVCLLRDDGRDRARRPLPTPVQR